MANEAHTTDVILYRLDEIGDKERQGPCYYLINSLRPRGAVWCFNDKSILAQVMSCCRQATRHCLSQCWLTIMGWCWYFHKIRPKYQSHFKITNLKTSHLSWFYELNFSSSGMIRSSKSTDYSRDNWWIVWPPFTWCDHMVTMVLLWKWGGNCQSQITWKWQNHAQQLFT